jgi:protoporphyrinogen/coproporphyrinogen III oxidase
MTQNPENSAPRKHIVVIGGGITGLTAAYKLSKAGGGTIDVTLLEAGERIGGSIATTQRDGFLLEQGPDAFISIKPRALALARELGIEDQVIGTNPQYRRSFVVRGNKLHAVPEGFYLLAPSSLWPMVRTSIFSWPAKLRMGLDLILPKNTSSEDESLAGFVTRRLGREALHRMAQPMIGGIYAADPEKLSLKATMPQFIEMEQKYGSIIRALIQRKKLEQQRQQGGGTSGPRYGLFVTFRDGMKTLTDKLVDEIPDGAIRRQSPVTGISQATGSSQWQVSLQNGETLTADGVCMGIQAPHAGKLLSDVDSTLSEQLGGIHYGDSTTVNLVFRREDVAHSLDGMGFVIPDIEKRSILGCSFSSQKFADRAPDGLVLLRVFLGSGQWADPDIVSDETLLEAVMVDLREYLGVTGQPVEALISRHARSMAHYYLGHLDRVDDIFQQLSEMPGLAVAGSGYYGIGVPDCIASAEKAVEKLLGDVGVTAAE